MSFSQITEYIKSPVPQEATPEYQKWIECKDALAFLVGSSVDQVPIYILAPHFFLYTALVPKNKLRGKYVDNLLQWNTGVSSGWGYGSAYNSETQRSEKYIFPPFSHTSSSILDESEVLVFSRSLYDNGDTYVEINQRLTHILGIHKVDARYAYCKVDENTGDLINIISFVKEDTAIYCIDRKSLDFYMFLTDTVLVQLFDVTRWSSDSFSSWEGSSKRVYKDKKNLLFARYAKDATENSAYLRGVHLIRPSKQSEKQMRAELLGETEKKKKYVSVIAHDWKHNKIHKCSCDPKKLGNYFVKSDLPFATSPAFFRPEVLLRYKQDTDKYEIRPGSISCRGAWYLRCNMNDAGQVQLYLIDLSHLPYSEQVYWQSFNEKPKSGISDDVFRRDFYGEWVSSPDPLEDLKQLLRDFPSASYRGTEAVLFKRPTEKQLAKLTYVFTDSAKEWEDQILELAKVLVDGLRKAELRKIAKVLNCDNPQAGSMLLLKGCLEAKGLDTENVQTINEPLRRLYELRSTIAAHPGRSAPNEDLKKHYRNLVQECKQAIESFAELIRTKYLDIS